MSAFSWRHKSLSRRDTTSSNSSSNTWSERSTSPISDRDHPVNARRARSIEEQSPTLYQTLDREEELAVDDKPPYLQHYIDRQVWKGNASPPVSNYLKDGKSHVLDIGSTPGWLLEMAGQYPLSVFVGIDLQSQFSSETKPPNAAFIECDVLDGIPFPKETFEVVHQSRMIAPYTPQQWRQVVADIIRVTKVGGWVEFLDVDFRFRNAGLTTKRLHEACITHLRSKGITPNIAPYIEGYLRDSGKILEMKVEDRTVPIGTWGGSLGQSVQHHQLSWFRQLSSTLAPIMGLDPHEYDSLISKLPKEFNQYRTTCLHCRVYGRKMLYS